MKKSTSLIVLMLFICLGVFAQETQGPSSTSQAVFLGKTIPLSEAATIEASNFGVDELTIIPNGYEGSFNNLVEGQRSSEGTLQREMGPFRAPNTIGANFPGIDNTQSGFLPPDPTGAVGPNHYVQAVNSSIAIYSKTGDLLLGPVALGTFLNNSSNSGDPIVLYDQLADRWLVSEFGNGAQSLLVGISETGDPTGAYNVYEILNGQFEDYPHYSIWPDGYYLTTNANGGGGGFNPREVFVLERDVMLAGGPNPQVIGLDLTGQFANPTTIFSAAAANLIGTDVPADTPGFFVYLQDDSWNGNIDADKLLVWEAVIDWDNVANSTISADPQEIPVDAFDSLFAQFGVGEINQPGTGQELAGQGGIISYNANYRSFEDHNSWLITFNVDVDGNDTSGIRWIELRNTAANAEWTLYQEGTYAPDDGLSRFMSSSAMDQFGNVGLAFNIGGAEMPVGIRYTGRFKNDPLGQMTLEENVIFDGPGVQTFSNRFGDYAHMTMDPDNLTFWHTTQYFLANNVWATRISSFQLTGGFANDVGVVDFISPTNATFSDSEVVEVVIRNFGTDPQSNFPVELRLDGVLVATETFTGTLPACEIANFTFVQTVDLSTLDQTYVLEATTVLAGDEDSENNPFSTEVTHITPNDIGVTAIISPVSGEGLTATEDVTIAIENFGGASQSNFEVSFDFDGTTIATETFAGPLDPLEVLNYTFTTATVDLSDFDEHTLTATTNLASDTDNSNDATTVTVQNQFCMPTSNCAGFDDGVTQFALADQDIATNCGDSPTGYSDDSDIVFNFALGDNPFEGVLQMGFNDSVFALWIDFNDNGAFEPNELIANDFVASANTDFAFTVDFEAIATVTTGSHRMRLRGEDESTAGNVLDPCDDLQFGRTNDYTANVTGTLNVEEQAIQNGDLVVSTLSENRFDVDLTTTFDGPIFMGVYNVLGQQLKVKQIAKRDNGYGLTLDMSSMSSGVYLLRISSRNSQGAIKTARIIVQ